ncbi:hypothetical protein G5I_06444 [Acromyrmex echinatior]|uniref:Uncharacterized protein n=1 Tax=Acromyrmex echinatior TaxID=103372 RepID=F4WL21_ACREC|nr:hypothetical protein G5I_06444 [Acromyrmex echinatior]
MASDAIKDATEDTTGSVKRYIYHSGDKVAVSRWGGREEKVKGKSVGAKPRRKGGHRRGRKLRRTMAHVTA